MGSINQTQTESTTIQTWLVLSQNVELVINNRRVARLLSLACEIIAPKAHAVFLGEKCLPKSAESQKMKSIF